MVTLLDDGSDTLVKDGRRKQVSCREELIGWLQRLEPQDAKALFADNEPLALHPILKIVERTSSIFLPYAWYIMNRIVTGHCDEQFPNNIAFFLGVSRFLHRHIHDQQKLLRLALRIASQKGGENTAEQIQDFNFLGREMKNALQALEEDMRFLVSAATIREGKLVAWISKFAFLFLPVSLLATILAIGNDYMRYYILGGLSVPFVLISTYMMFFWKPSAIDSLLF